MELAEQRCTACEGGIPPFTHEQAVEYMSRVPGWELPDDLHIERTFRFRNFAEAMAFANRIAEIAEQEKHHPELHISWGRVRVELSTHAVKGLSTNDFILAAKINKLEG